MMNELIKECIKDNSLIICPDSFKNSILDYMRENKLLTNGSFMTLEEFKKNKLFDYDVKTIKYVMERESLSLENAQELIDNLYYVENKDYHNDKLNHLVEVKEDLKKKGLLITNELFEKYLSNKDVTVCGYGKLDRFSKKITGTEGLSFVRNEKPYAIHTFDDKEEETEWLYNQIADLLRSGVDINNIYVLNASEEYESYFKRYNGYYGFTIDGSVKESVIGLEAIKGFKERINNSKEELYDYLVKLEDEDLKIQLINLLNKYCEYDLKDVEEFILHDLKELSVRSELREDVVSLAAIYQPFSDNDYVFMVGFNENVPVTARDTDYFSDKEKSLLGVSTSEQMNVLNKENILSYLSGINNLYLSYSKNDPFNEYNPSGLLEMMDHVEIKEEERFEYCDSLNRQKYAIRLDTLNKYDEQDQELMSDLFSTYGTNEYLSYDNSFKGLTDKQINDLKEVYLSYSSMNGFYECQFKYYLDRVVKVMRDEGNFNTKLGNICHEVLKDSLKEGFDFEESWQRNCEKFGQDLKASEEFFLNRTKGELETDIAIIRQQQENSLFTAAEGERKIEVDVAPGIHFIGYIDKIMVLQKEDKLIVCIVDYKTGSSAKIDRKLMKEGLSLQLPSYMYLLSNDPEYKDLKLKFAGFYLQHIIASAPEYDPKTTAIEEKIKSMRLEGFTSADLDRIAVLDNSLEAGASSSTVKNLSITVQGSLGKTNKNILLDEEFDELIKLTENKIIEAGNSILSGDFRINPKIRGTDNISCTYCQYGNICYRRVKDNVYLKLENESEEKADE